MLKIYYMPVCTLGPGNKTRNNDPGARGAPQPAGRVDMSAELHHNVGLTVHGQRDAPGRREDRA